MWITGLPTAKRAIDLLRLEEAEVIVYGTSWQEANQLANTMVGETDAFIHQFDDPLSVSYTHLTLPTIYSISTVPTSLGAKRVCDKAAEYARTRTIISKLVTDASAVRACMNFVDDHRVLTEPACGDATTTLEQLTLVSTRLEIKGS